MKITITKESKGYLTVNEYEVAKTIVNEMREENINDIAMMAANIATNGAGQKVLEATAEICRNNRVNNQYNDESGMLDIWVTATVKTYDGFVIVSACLSDIWQSTGDNYSELQRHMSIEIYDKRN